MTRKTVDPYAAVTYGSFAATQVLAHALNVAPSFARALRDTVDRLIDATERMAAALKHASEAAVAGQGPRPGEGDSLTAARDVIERLVSYAGSRPGGKLLAATLLNQQPLPTVMRQRGAMLLPALDHALAVVAAHRDKLPEHAAWTHELATARASLAQSSQRLRPPPPGPTAVSPEVSAAHQDWLRIYSATQLIVEGIFRLQNIRVPMPDIFANLADSSRRVEDD